ncbi:hypothetical protein ambt_08175 [Alteromonas naphthalenivorans]|uniref:Uncharacterized protein n=1 Tax=Alteromonas naphthalenivorans TaxID=715451 RepID=F5Z7X0_ALTNA|nr:hypothetical protein ambt_08175 [Alteromonas naphthalenivorans]
MDYVLTIKFAAWRTLLIIYGGFINTIRMVITNKALLSLLSIFIWKQISQVLVCLNEPLSCLCINDNVRVIINNSIC